MIRRITGAAALSVCAVSFAADHREAPLITEDSPADIADIYVFNSPTTEGNVVLAMTVNGFSIPTEAITYRFSPNVRHNFNIDTDGDGAADRTIRVLVDRDAGTYSVDFPGTMFDFDGDVTQPTEEPEPNPALIANGPNGVMGFVGPRDDPFFFDIVGFFRFLAGTGGFTGTDSFADVNVSAIVIEAPLAAVSDGLEQFAVWGETERRRITLRRGTRGQLEREVGPWERIERMGNPAVNTALITPGLKDLYNVGLPEDDADDFAGTIVASLQALGTNEENINILASVAVPDTLKIDTTATSEYPNGRAPADDVVDTLFFFIFNQPKTPVTDMVDGNDVPFIEEFPYLAPPQQAP